ncbi:hypothetical protein FB563_0713 [Streptomyces puniciscabiei]|uniref:Uncharacterized protein n=1 Tax=Streptomyces puniciscabiei TaxID=164348 RepID=A0A542U9M6_9ACTN|nr:hypothetical protein FB563_0713 [Streptomyces puniciscabiei]
MAEPGFDPVVTGGHLPAVDGGVTAELQVLLAAVARATGRIGLVAGIPGAALYDPVVPGRRATPPAPPLCPGPRPCRAPAGGSR